MQSRKLTIKHGFGAETGLTPGASRNGFCCFVSERPWLSFISGFPGGVGTHFKFYIPLTTSQCRIMYIMVVL